VCECLLGQSTNVADGSNTVVDLERPANHCWGALLTSSTMPYAHTYPLAPCGGLFVLTVGLGTMLGAIFPRFRNPLLAASGVAAGLGLWAFGASITERFGAPTPLQLWSLVVAIAFEVAVIAVVVRRLRTRGERTLNLAILVGVGAHFLLMAPAFGPLIVVLGLLAMLNAVYGLRSPGFSFRAVWFLDGVLKVAIGGVLWLIVPFWE
jgi:hypothetical protein